MVCHSVSSFLAFISGYESTLCKDSRNEPVDLLIFCSERGIHGTNRSPDKIVFFLLDITFYHEIFLHEN